MAASIPKPTSELDLSKPEDILAYLANTPFASTRVEELPNAWANYVFRLYLSKPLVTADNASTLIFKHVKPWYKQDKNYKYDVSRQTAEAIAMRHAHALVTADSPVTVPALFLHDADAHVLIMEDAGPGTRSLKDFLISTPLDEANSQKLGTALGNFLAALHVHGTADTMLFQSVEKNVEGKKFLSWFVYEQLVPTLQGKSLCASPSPDDAPLIVAEGLSEAKASALGAITDAKAKKVNDGHTHFSMGDFWPGNVVVRVGDSGAIEHLYVIDWEIASQGLPFVDYAQFMAEIVTLQRFHPKADASVAAILSAFAKAYKEVMKPDEEFARDVITHVGAYMTTATPTVKTWGSKEKVRDVMKEGVGYVEQGSQADVQWLKTSIVGDLLPDSAA